MEHIYIADARQHHEINLVFDVELGDADPSSQEENLEFDWLPLDRVADSDVRLATLNDALAPADVDGVDDLYLIVPSRGIQPVRPRC